MRNMFVVVLALFVHTVAFGAQEFKGPFDIAWGSSQRDVKAKVPKRFKFEKALSSKNTDLLGDTTLRFKGEFAGMPTGGVEFEFKKDKLMGVGARILTQDADDASKKFEELKTMLSEKYGDPSMLEAAYQARWSFENGSIIILVNGYEKKSEPGDDLFYIATNEKIMNDLIGEHQDKQKKKDADKLQKEKAEREKRKQDL